MHRENEHAGQRAGDQIERPVTDGVGGERWLRNRGAPSLKGAGPRYLRAGRRLDVADVVDVHRPIGRIEPVGRAAPAPDDDVTLRAPGTDGREGHDDQRHRNERRQHA